MSSWSTLACSSQTESAVTVEFVAGSPRLAVDVVGSGPPVVFLHGVGGRRQNWDRQVNALDGTFTTFAWDARGYGDSADDLTRPRRFGDFADDLERLLDHFDIERAHLVGLSMGARIVMDFAVDRPGRLATLVLADCFYAFDSSLTPDKQEEYVALRAKPLMEGKSFADLAPALIESLVSPHASAEARDELRASIEALRADSYLATLRSSLTFDRGDDLPSITAPTQLVFGSDDRLTPASIGEEMVSIMSDASLAVIEGAGHLSNIEAPEEFNEILRGFLAAHRDRASFGLGHRRAATRDVEPS